MIGNKAAILIVTGGQDPQSDKWLELCIHKILEHTEWPHYHIYVWNNNVGDLWVKHFLDPLPNVTLIQTDPPEEFAHFHAGPLQRLYELALNEGARYILTMDSDAHPIRSGWLTHLVQALDKETALAGIWRDELSAGIAPYLHASCLCTTVDFIKDNRIRFDFIASNTNSPKDTLSSFTDKALALKCGIYKLRRSNRNNFHRLMGGIYGDLVYHHGAGSRKGITFWDEGNSPTLKQDNQAIRDLAAELLFKHYGAYISWLRGCEIQSSTGNPVDFVFVLGMHRSGTSCLAGCLERCGLYLGEVSRSNEFNLKGNYELRQVVALHDEILAASGGSWSHPPMRLSVDPSQKQMIARIVSQLASSKPCGLKDPRLLLLADTWLEAVNSYTFVGTFRHPVLVARSLMNRNQIPEEQAYQLWVRYNRELVRLHQRYHFPIMEYDLSDPVKYCETIAMAAVTCGLDPNLKQLRDFVDVELSHYSSSGEAIPPTCQEVYAYLFRNRYSISSQNDAAAALVRLRRQYGMTINVAERCRSGRLHRIRNLPLRLVYLARHFLRKGN